jgi:transitional endoplasmic reticulum ATPase
MDANCYEKNARVVRNMVTQVELKVKEAIQSDIGAGIVRLDGKTRKSLGVSSGDIVLVEGKKKTAALVWQSYLDDENQEVVRMDSLIRQNCNAGPGDKVKISKAEEVKEAKKVVFAPFRPLRFAPDFFEYMKKSLLDRPILKGDTIVITVFREGLLFKAVNVHPKGIIQITNQTKIEIRDEPIKEGEEFSHIAYEDIGGLGDEVKKVREMIELPLKHPELFSKLGVDAPKGVLLYGPPGTGKTLLAKAVANESDANFYSIQGPEIISKFVGEAEERLRNIFSKAAKEAPSIIFIDEIDAIAPKRGEVVGEVEKRVVAQLLSLMDGLKGRGKVVVIAATNRPNALDEALRRPGRFDREIELGVPDKKGRLEILQIHIRGMPLAKDVDIKDMARRTHGYVGADLAALARESAMKTLRRVLPDMNLEEETISAELLDKLIVTKNDVQAAFHEVQPSAMREVLIETPNIRWDEVGGLESVKKELIEAIEWPIENPDMFKRLGIRAPRGIFLYGPPGTGKTLLAKAVATETESNFISVRGPELLSKWVGESEKGIRETFRKARQAAPCIIFFDEVDSIAPRRGMHMGSNVTETVVNQILTEIDGLEELKDVVVIAATNRPDIVDPALLRPGRFDKLIQIPVPDQKTRLEILKVHTKKTPLEKGINLEAMSKMLDGYSGADLQALVQEAAMNALRSSRESKEVSQKNFDKALEIVKPSLSNDVLKGYSTFKEDYKGAEYR